MTNNEKIPCSLQTHLWSIAENNDIEKTSLGNQLAKLCSVF